MNKQPGEAKCTVRAVETLDLMRDEFSRIKVLTENKEIIGLCERAVSKITQHVPVIQQRDFAEKELTSLRARLLEAQKNLAKESTFRERIATKRRFLSDQNAEFKALIIALREHLAQAEQDRDQLKQKLLACEAVLMNLKSILCTPLQTQQITYSAITDARRVLSESSQTSLTEALNRVRASVEAALDSLCDGASAKQYDPSWIRPMGMSKVQVQEACVQAYYQIHQALSGLDKLCPQGI